MRKDVPIAEAVRDIGKPPIATRWVVNVKKGDCGERVVCARLMAKDFLLKDYF